DGGGLIQSAEPLARSRLGGFLSRLWSSDALQRNACALGQQFQRLAEVERLLFLDEGNEVAALATAEAVPVLLIGEDIERRGSFAVKGAESLIGLARFLERDDRPDLFDDIELLFDTLDGARSFRCHGHPLGICPWIRSRCASL